MSKAACARTGASAIAAFVLAAALGLAAPGASAADALNFAKPFPVSFTFTPINLAIETGIFQKHGLDVTYLAFNGGGKLHQAVAAGEVDMEIASGTDMAFIAKGSPEKAVAKVAGAPYLLGVTVRNDVGVNSIADLKGKKIAVVAASSLPAWLLRQLATEQGWSPDAIEAIAVNGGDAASLAVLRTKQVDGIATVVNTGYELEARGEAKFLLNFGNHVKTFITHALYASDKMIAERPDVVRRFIIAWFETIAYMRQHKDETVRVFMATDHVTDAAIAARVYDEVMPVFTHDGHFDRAALDVVKKSYVELGLLDHEPDMTPLYTEAFLPAKE